MKLNCKFVNPSEIHRLDEEFMTFDKLCLEELPRVLQQNIGYKIPWIILT